MNVNREAWTRNMQWRLGDFGNFSAFAVRKNYGIFTAHARLAVLVCTALRDTFNGGAIFLAFKISGVSRGTFRAVRGRYKKTCNTSIFV